MKWQVVNLGKQIKIADENFELIADVASPKKPTQSSLNESMQNAQLLSVAPELRDCLIDFIHWSNIKPTSPNAHIMKRALDVLAKSGIMN